MTDGKTIKWEDFDPLRDVHDDYADTRIECPVCGRLLKRYTKLVYVSNPPMFRYECFNCGWNGYK